MMRRLLRLVDINTGETWRKKQFSLRLYLFFTLSGANSYTSAFQLFRNDPAAAARRQQQESSSWQHHENNHHRAATRRNDVTRGLTTCFLMTTIKRSEIPHFSATTPTSTRARNEEDDDDLLLLSPPPPSTSCSSIGREELRQDEADILYNNNNDEAWFASLPKGTTTGFRIIKQYIHNLPGVGEDFDLSILFGEGCEDDSSINDNDVQRLELTPQSITLPVALMMADPDEYPSFSRARKACRKGHIVILTLNAAATSPSSTAIFDPDRFMRRGRVGDRIFPGDVLAKQVRVGDGYSPILSYKKPPFDLPVIVEDDHFALINKPAGVVVYGHHKGGHGIMTVRAALPFCLKPPRAGTLAIMRRPTAVHRLDRATSGILCIAKTKPAMVHLSRQFHNRIIQKTYMAIINGIPQESGRNSISIQRARELGVDIQPDHDSPYKNNGSYSNSYDAASNNNSEWQLIDSPLDGKHTVTVWRAIRYVPSLHAHDGYLTLVEMKPKTGRFHQLRRHMAWVCKRPIVGDVEYDNNTPEAQKFRSRGLFLCSSSITLQHPFLNNITSTTAAPQEAVREKEDSFKTMLDDNDGNNESQTNGSQDDKGQMATDDRRSNKIWRSSENGKFMVSATIELPEKFESLLAREAERFRKFNQETALCS